MTNESSTDATPSQGAKVGLFAAVGAALAASICCLGPLALVSLGATGAWIGSLSALEPYRPLFMAATAAFLGFAFLRVYRREPESCEPGSACEKPATKQVTKMSLWLVTLLVLGLFASPYFIGQLSAGTAQVLPATTETATLAIEGMTCESCSATVRTSLTRLDGVVTAQVTYEPPQAVVEFDPTKLNAKKLAEATASVGYPSHVAD